MPTVLPDGPYEPTWESLTKYQVPEWYQNAKFGIFIHWGVYAVPGFGNEWYPRNMYREGTDEFKHHIETYGPQKEFGYKDFIPRFTAERFDPAHWADLFRRSGARYVMPVAEHHDGFQMYDSALSNWNAAKMGPKRDLIADLAAEVRQQGMIFCASSHRAEHWWFFDGGRKFDSDVTGTDSASLYAPAQPEATQPDEAFLDDWLARTCELVDKYRPQVVWFDWWIEQPAFRPYLRKFAAYYYNRAVQWGVGVAINYKKETFPTSAAVFDVERGQLDDLRPYFWQTDTSVAKNSWGYVHNQDYKTADSIIHDLIDIVSKNGCLLLNIGPRPDGTIPEPEEQMLLEIGNWLASNGEAIYDTRPWRLYGEGPTQVVGGSFNDTKREPFTGEDMRFTVKGDTLYVILLGWPEQGTAIIRSLSSHLPLYRQEAFEITLLGTSEPLKWSRDADGLKVQLPAQRPAGPAYTLKISKQTS